jgi:hypothetical protein
MGFNSAFKWLNYEQSTDHSQQPDGDKPQALCRLQTCIKLHKYFPSNSMKRCIYNIKHRYSHRKFAFDFKINSSAC